MINKIISTLTIFLILGSAQTIQASPHSNIDLMVFDNRSYQKQELWVKNDVPYDESQDSNQRRGTENWEESQSSFLIFPGLILGVIALLAFFSRD